MKTNLDHLVVAAHDLQQGTNYIKERLGVDIPYGGQHPKMGTHNCLMQLNDNLFLEVIAIAPDIVAPSRPRWFGLDEPMSTERLIKSPQLLAWVVNCDDIYNVINHAMKNAVYDFGKPESLSRGTLTWDFALPADGRLLAGGFLPYLIEWHCKEHPATMMADVGVQLISLEISHLYPEWLTAILSTIGADKLVNISRATNAASQSLTAIFSTPNGICRL